MQEYVPGNLGKSKSFRNSFRKFSSIPICSSFIVLWGLNSAGYGRRQVFLLALKVVILERPHGSQVSPLLGDPQARPRGAHSRAEKGASPGLRVFLQRLLKLKLPCRQTVVRINLFSLK